MLVAWHLAVPSGKIPLIRLVSSFSHIRRHLRRAARDVRDSVAAQTISLFPFVADLRTYTADAFRYDIRAAINVAILAVPQSIAFAAMAELPIVFGILCAAVASIVAPLFAGSRHTVPGPTNATAFMLFSFFATSPMLVEHKVELIPLLVMMIGLFSICGALLRVADLLQYVSRSVLVGYITGAAVLIIASQMKHVLGIGDHIDASTGNNSFFGLLSALVSFLYATSWQTALVAVSTFVCYYGLRWWKPKWPCFAITLIFISAIFGPLAHFGPGGWNAVECFHTYALSDLVPTFPNLLRKGIFDDIAQLLGVAFAIAFLSSLENTLMAKTIASQTGDRSDVNQDMFAVGMANVASAVAGGMPASGSLTRSLLNFTSGAQTRFSAVMAGLLTLVAAALIALTKTTSFPLIDFVPKSCLGALVIALAFSLFNREHVRISMRSTRDDAFVLVITFLATLLAPLHVAIFIGVGLSIILFLRKASRPFLIEYEFNDAGELRAMGEKRQRPNPAISIVHVEGDLFFGAAELFRNQIQRTAADESLRIIVLRLKNARHLDATSVMALQDLIRFMRANGRHVIISGATREVYRVLRDSGVMETVQEGCDREKGESNIFLNAPSNPNLSTRHALKRAQQLLGDEKAEIRIFYDPNKK